MQLRRYSILSVLLLAGIGIYIYINDSADYTMTFGENPVTMPLALWTMLPAIVLFAVSISHLAFYSATGYLQKSSLNKDIKTLKKLLFNSLVGQKGGLTLKHPSLNTIGKVLSGSTLTPDETTDKSDDPELNALLEQLARVRHGEIGDFSAIKLPRDSAIRIANQLNRMTSDPKISEELLRDTKEGSEVYFKALAVYATYGDKKRFLRSDTSVNADSAIALLSRYKALNNGLDFDSKEIIELCAKANFCVGNYMTLAQKLKAQAAPERLLEIFCQLKNADDKACLAWLYINIELERLEDVKETLEGSDHDEYLPIKAYLALKNAGFSPSLDTLISCVS
ncbi:hypothetical protein FACS1894103_7150 [Campylobacterota bacterium]|nr:hypothetical protein FACS1894103_7150 [Campylobacterota bacterium]